MPSEEALENAMAAVTALVADRGVNVTFPLDAIWPYSPQPLASTQKPSMGRALVNLGYLTRTGGMTRAVSAARAGSPTQEYRPGPHFLPSEPEAPATPTEAAPLPVATQLANMVAALEVRGFITTSEQVVNFYLALLSSPIVIMTGTSGTGKSRLPRLFAEIMVGESGFCSVPVKPQWDDNSDMFGFTSPVQVDQFVRGKFTSAIEAANANPTRPFIVLLDEMNLAAVEHYFSDFLSVVESRRRVDGAVVTDRLPLDLPQLPVGADDPYAALRNLFLPASVRVVGTANMDETTRSFSPKVLDRAFSIEFADANLTEFPMAIPPATTGDLVFTGIADRLVDSTNPVSIREAYTGASALCDEAAGYLETIRLILAPTGISFAYRTRDAVCYYMFHWAKDNLEALLPKADALDYCILQKVLPKIHGQGEVLARTLQTLKHWLDGNPVEPYSQSPGFNRSAEKLQRMITRLDADGTTTYWGT
jgi:energy-coupling factor transporter ATP-binding protein EcfA2